jgi:Arylsulfotransferase (ASST)
VLKPMAMILDAPAHAKGFIITSPGLGGGQIVSILDTDGDPVWWTVGPSSTTRAHMSWDGKDMYMLSEVIFWKIGMDGQQPHEVLAGFEHPNHDFTAIPNGVAALDLSVADHRSFVARTSEGIVTPIVPDVSALYAAEPFHPNALHYYPWDDSYTLSDLYGSLFVKFTGEGELVWQLGGTAPKDPAKFFKGAPAWKENHGHQLLADGSFVFFDNGYGGNSKIHVLALDTTTMTATESFSYTLPCGTPFYGDVQRLANGNYLVTCSNDGKIIEMTSSGGVVATLTNPQPFGKFGYSEFRESLYGPPPY